MWLTKEHRFVAGDMLNAAVECSIGMRLVLRMSSTFARKIFAMFVLSNSEMCILTGRNHCRGTNISSNHLVFILNENMQSTSLYHHIQIHSNTIWNACYCDCRCFHFLSSAAFFIFVVSQSSSKTFPKKAHTDTTNIMNSTNIKDRESL